MSAETEFYSGCQWLARWGHAPWITWPFLAGCLTVSVSTWFSSRCYPFLPCLCRIHLAAKKKTRIVPGNFYELHALTGDTYEARVALPLPSLSFWLTLPLLSCLATSSVHEWTIFDISVGTRTVIGQLSRPYFTLYGQWSQRFCFVNSWQKNIVKLLTMYVSC